MRLLKNLDAIDADLLHGVVSVGNFDGVHQGHRQILSQVKSLASELGGPSIVFTFDPHPLALLRPEVAPVPLCWAERKAELLEQLGIDCLVAFPTTAALLQLDYREFFQELIVDRLQARGMVEGPNFFFGRDRKGDIRSLQRLCDSAKIRMRVVELIAEGPDVVSSSRIRKLIAAGDIAQANRLLTAPYLIRGQVEKGDQRGRELGFPTANLCRCPVLVPGSGVYAGRARCQGGDYSAAVHIGPNPTFGIEQRKIEVHLLGFDGDLYGEEMLVELHHRLREVRPFDSVDGLKQQLTKDIAKVRECMNGTEGSEM